ncbi:MAG TPA: secretin N-terminal domain-containing protein [Steroidobacteraceae bacterium]
MGASARTTEYSLWGIAVLSEAHGAQDILRRSQPRRAKHFASAIVLALIACVAFAQSLEVIELKHRTAQEIIPVLQPLLAPGGSLTGQDYTLFVRTTSTNLAELKRVVAQLDRAPRQLLVSVRTSAQQDLQRESVQASGEISTRGARARVSGSDTNTTRQGEGVSSVIVLEGNAALINHGSSVPIVTAVVAGRGRSRWIGGQVEWRDLPNGFLVTPRVNGEDVILDIRQRSDALRGGTVETQEVSTQVSGRLGEWIELGGATSSEAISKRGLGSRRYSTQADDRKVWVKVEIQ